MNRRSFLGGIAAAGAFPSLPGSGAPASAGESVVLGHGRHVFVDELTDSTLDQKQSEAERSGLSVLVLKQETI